MKNYFVHKTSIIDKYVSIGENTKIWHFSHILEKSKIGKNCIIGQNVMIGPDVKIGNNCKIQNNVSLYKGVELSDFVFCGPSCVFTNVCFPRAGIEKKNEFEMTFVGKHVTIGANSTILCGVKLEDYSFIAAGAVVTKSTKKFSLVAGCPAKHIGWVGHYGERLDKNLICPVTKKKYLLQNGDLIEK